jgi:hypothetical protein
MQQAEAVRTRAIVISHSKFNDALIELVSTSPNATNEALALALQHRTGPKVPLDYLVEQVKVYRAGQSALIRKIRISQANSSYAKYLK